MSNLRKRKVLSDSVHSGWYDRYSRTSSGGECMFAEVYKKRKLQGQQKCDHQGASSCSSKVLLRFSSSPSLSSLPDVSQPPWTQHEKKPQEISVSLVLVLEHTAEGFIIYWRIFDFWEDLLGYVSTVYFGGGGQQPGAKTSTHPGLS